MKIEALEGGRFVKRVNELFEQVEADFAARPMLKGKRVVTMTVTLDPEIDADAGMCYPHITCNVTLKLPGVRGQTVVGILREGGAIEFNDLSEDNPRQGTIDEINVTPMRGKEKA